MATFPAPRGAFRGVFPAPDLVPAPFGLLSVADVKSSDANSNNDIQDKWIRGYSIDYYSNPSAIDILDKYNDTVTNGQLSTSDTDNYFLNIDPFFIQVEDNGSLMGVLGLDRRDRIMKQLIASTQKAAEWELWNGGAALAEASIDNSDVLSGSPFLIAEGGANILTNGGVDPRNALWQLEGAVSNSPIGIPGVIHMSRDVASFLTQNKAIGVHTGPDGQEHLRTALGTPVIAGAGYTGNGPIGQDDADASATNKWAFVTGPVAVFLGDPEIVNKDYSEGVKTSTNDYLLRAQRPASVYFDTSVFYAAQITIPDTP